MSAPPRRDPAVTRPWLHAGTAVLRSTLARIPDAALARPSVLPGWSRAHVVGHVARNAEALTRLATGARTGAASPGYAAPDERAAEVAASARHPPARLRADLEVTAVALDAALDRFDGGTWQRRVPALGPDVPAAEIPWLRVREVWLHAVDLDAGVRVADLPAGVLDALLDDVAAALPARGQRPVLRLEPADRDRTWTLGADRGTALSGTAASLVGWLTGRTGGTDLVATAGLRPAAVPPAPRWP